MEKKYVLIADDEPDVRSVLKEIIQNSCKGVFVIEAVDGADAIRKIKLQKFHLAIVDLKMPRLDGHMVLSGIKDLPYECKPDRLLVISALSSAEQIKQQHDLTVDYISKPFQSEQIEAYLQNALGKAAAPQPAGAGFDINIVNSFIDATIKVLDTMAQTPSVKDSLYLRGPEMISGDISAILSIVSSKSRGSLAISFGKDCFLAVVNRMLGESYTEITADNADAAAELCNQIFGIAKKEINSAGNDLKPAIPSIVTGENHRIQHKTSGPCVVVKFKTDSGYFTVETVMEACETEKKAAA